MVTNLVGKAKKFAEPVKSTKPPAHAGEILRLPPPRILPIMISELGVDDERYQRALRQERLIRMAKECNWHERFIACGGDKEKERQLLQHLRNCIGIITVARGADGKYQIVALHRGKTPEYIKTPEVIDGQYRTALLALLFLYRMGFEDVEVWCEVVEGCTEEYAAELFKIRNETKPMTALERYKSRVAAGKEPACKLKRFLSDNKIGVSGLEYDASLKSQLYGKIKCVDVFQTVFDTAGAGPLAEAIAVIVDVWGRDAKGNIKPWKEFSNCFQAGPFGGLCEAIIEHPERTRKEWVKTLGKLSRQDFVMMGSQSSGWARREKAGHKIVEFMNTHCPKRKRKPFVR
jgi:hypothetical protein